MCNHFDDSGKNTGPHITWKTMRCIHQRQHQESVKGWRLKACDFLLWWAPSVQQMIKEERRKKTHLYDDTVRAALPEAKVKMFHLLIWNRILKTTSAVGGAAAPVLACPERSWRFSKQIRGRDTKMEISVLDANVDLQGYHGSDGVF